MINRANIWKENSNRITKTFIALLLIVMVSLALGFGPVSSAAAEKKTTTKIKIAASRVGSPFHIFSEALAYFINHSSDWLRCTVVATPGTNDNAMLEAEKPQEYLSISLPNNIIRISKDKRFNYYDGDRFIATANSLTAIIVSYDKKITKAEDLAGKNVMVGRKGRYSTYDFEAILEAHGVWDKIKVQYGGFGDAKTALKDGLIDAAVVVVDQIYPQTFAKGAYITDLETKNPIYYVTLDPVVLKKLWKEEKYGGIPAKIPARALDPKTQPTDIWTFNWPCYFGADEQMNPDIVYEVARVIWESSGQWSKWHPQGAHMIKKFLPAMPVDFKYVHPAAKKFYEDQGVQLKYLADLIAD